MTERAVTRRAALAAAAAAAAAVATAGKAQTKETMLVDLPLTKLSETPSTITFAWTPPPGTVGYYFYADGTRVSNSTNPAQTQVRFRKVASGLYAVKALVVAAEGNWPPIIPPPPTGSLLWRETFEGSYGLTPDLNPNLHPPVSDPPTVPAAADKISDQRSWSTTNPANYTVAPSPTGGRALRISRDAGQNVCWASRWTYRQPGPRYYGYRVFLPSDWRNPTDPAANGGKGEWAVAMEMNYHPFVFGGGPANLSIYGDWMKLGVVSGYCEGNGVSTRGGVQFADYKNGGSWENVPSTDAIIENWPDDEFEVIPRGQMNKNVWHEIILGVNWTVGPKQGGDNGWYKAWWRRADEPAFRQTVDFAGSFPTFNWGLDVGGVAWTPSQMVGCATWFDYGLYSPPHNWSNTYWLDNLCEGTTFDAVAETFS